MNISQIIDDIDIVIEAINNDDKEDAINMILDIKEDLKIILLAE